ncbi:MAG: hypothetical protein ABSG56_18410 [Bryobacteraceae bacterium]
MGSSSCATAIPKQEDFNGFKLFGPGGSPSNHFQKGLRILFDLDDEAWEVLAKWFLTSTDFDSEEAASSPAIAASALLPEQFSESVDILKYILESWYMYGLQVPEIQRDLLLLNCPRKRIERLGSLLERLRPARDRVYRDYMRFDHENAVLPTLEDVNVVCDLRPVFEDTVYPIPEASPVRHTRLLGYSYLVLMELFTEDFGGRTQRLGFQMNEATLADFQAALQRAREQLDILKASTSAISTQER